MMTTLKDRMALVAEAFEPIEGWYPLEVQIEITYDCTLRCAMCYNGVRANERKFEDYLKECDFSSMDEEKRNKLYHVVDICLESGAKFFTITGGEPLLYMDVVLELIKKIKEHGCYASINSNATTIDDSAAKRLKEAGLDSALISIHGADEKTHAKTVSVNDVFELTIKGIKALINNGIHVVPNFVASHINSDKLYETGVMLYDMGMKRQAYSMFIPTPGNEEHDVLKLTFNDTKMYFEQLNKLNTEYPNLHATATLPVPPCLSKGVVAPEVLEKFEFRTCPSGRQFMVVNADGNVSPCIQYAWNETRGSNILNKSATEVAKKLSLWKRLFATPKKCFDCDCKGFCNPCNMNILKENDGVLSASSTPYPEHQGLTAGEATSFKKKFEIPFSNFEKPNVNQPYKFKDNVIFRKETAGHLTIINPRIQGYTVIKDQTRIFNDLDEVLQSHDLFFSSEDKFFFLFKAMDAIEPSERRSKTMTFSANIEMTPKFKILTEFIGFNFNNPDAVYCTRTDTAGRFFCLANTMDEQAIYDEARAVYMEYLEI